MNPADFGRAAWAVDDVLLLFMVLALFAWILALERDFRKLQRRISDLEHHARLESEKIFLPERLRPRWWW